VIYAVNPELGGFPSAQRQHIGRPPVWESREAWERFQGERLMPAIEEVARAAGMEPTPPQRMEVYDLHDLMP
jgi:hypothetical protein